MIELYEYAPYMIRRELYMPDPEVIPYFIEAVDEVAQQKLPARQLARIAAFCGFLLIPSNFPKENHYPIRSELHTYIDLEDSRRKPIPEALTAGKYALRAGLHADIAILGALFGDFNNKRERQRRCMSITGQEINFGWSVNYDKTESEPIYVGEDAHVTTHARPELIAAATDPNNPFTGFIHASLPHPSYRRIEHDIGQYIGTARRRTIFSIPVVGSLDLPPDILPTNYTEDNMPGAKP